MIWVTFGDFSLKAKSSGLGGAVRFSRGERQAFTPPQDLKVSEWADKNRILQPGTSRQPGQWRTENTPYLQEIMDTYNHPDIRHTVVCAGTQIGKSEVILNTIGYIIDLDPFSTMMVYPREDDAKRVSRTRLQPMIKACHSLREKIPHKADLFQTLEQHYPGMTLYLVGANSAAGLAEKPCRNIIRDEIDKYPDLVGKDADPLSLSEARAKSFWDIRNVLDVSSPTLETRGIYKELQVCEDIRYYEVPCPACDEFQTLKMDNIRWEGGGKDFVKARATALYFCRHCGVGIQPGEKQRMLARGKWVSTKNPTFQPQSVGFQLSSLYSPWLTWGDIAEAFLKAKQKQEEFGEFGALQDFINGWLAEPWVQKISSVSFSDLFAAKCELKRHDVPDEAVAITAGIDVQKAGFWYVLRAWARDYSSWLIDYGFLPDWEHVETLLFSHPYPVPIWRALIDIGGGDRWDSEVSSTEEVYMWLRKNGRGRGCNVWGSKGSSKTLTGKLKVGSPLERTPSGKAIPGGLQIVSLDTQKLKDAFWYRVEQAKTGGTMAGYLHHETGEDYAKQIFAEEKQRDRHGQETWIRKHKDNHLFDCEVMAHAAADPEFFGGLRMVRKAKASPTKEEPVQEKGEFSQRAESWLGIGDKPWIRR
jgi:terminase, large subunit